MVKICSIKFCRSEHYRGCPYKLHSIPSKPSNAELKQKWLAALDGHIKGKSIYEKKHVFVCSQHFKSSDYYDTSKRLLKSDAVPSIFLTETEKIVHPRSTFQKLIGSLKCDGTSSLLIDLDAIPIETQTNEDGTSSTLVDLNSVPSNILTKALIDTLDTNTSSGCATPINQDIEIETDPLGEIENLPLKEDLSDVNSNPISPASPTSPFPSNRYHDICMYEPPEELILSPSYTDVGVQARSTGSDVSIQTETAKSANQPISPAEQELRRKVKVLQNRLIRREATIQKLRYQLTTGEIKDIQPKKQVKSGIICLRKDFDADKSDKSMRYSDDLKQFALSLYFQSPKVYDFLRDYIVLPHPASLRRY